MRTGFVSASFLAITMTVAGLPALAANSTPLPSALRPVLYRALAADSGSVRARDSAGCVMAPTSTLRACFGSFGARFSGAGFASLAIRLVAYGRRGHVERVAAVRPRVRAGRVSYRHGVLTEWWRMLPRGFEQGFTIRRRPAGQGRLTIALAASARGSGRGGTLAWGRLRYGGLVVTDAHGKVVASSLENGGGRILLAVRDGHAAYPLTIDPVVWVAQKLTASDGAGNDAFGYSVAVSATTALVGAPYAGVGSNYSEGKVYVFTESSGVWTQDATLTANDGITNENFGWSVGVDGTTAVVGAPYDTVGTNADQGAVYVYTESNGTWTQTQKLVANDGAANDHLGYSVAVNGNNVLAGALSANVGGNLLQGAAYMFTDSGGTWTQQKLTANDGGSYDFFGTWVALSGPTAAIGSPQSTVNGNYQQGAVYVFTEAGGSWSQAQKLTASDGAAGDFFGISVELDTSDMIIGAPFATVNGNFAQGAAYVFHSAVGNWTQAQKLTAGDGAAFDEFGYSVAIDGTNAVSASPYASVDGNYQQGAAYTFAKSGGTWSQTDKLFASDGESTDNFGFGVAIAGVSPFIGVPYADVGANYVQGAAYVFGQGDLDLALSAPDSVAQGADYVSQTIATNSASVTSPAVSVTVPVPAAASFVSASASQGTCSQASEMVTCAFGPIAANGGTATASVTLEATGSSGQTIDNRASVAWSAPALTASAPTAITTCAAGYTEHDGSVSPGGTSLAAEYVSGAGSQNGVLMGPSGVRLYVVVTYGGTHHVYEAPPDNQIHHLGPAAEYSWVVKAPAGSPGGAYAFCLKHP